MKYVLFENDQAIAMTIARGFTPKNSYPAPEGIRHYSEAILQDMLDPETNEVLGKKAVLDPTKVAAYDAQLASESDTKAWADLRTKRNSLLTATDHTQLNDAPLTAQQKTDYATYRQELRDLPANTVDPTNPSWPVEPS